jgi:NADH:ubiquinone oxidoreductase subunit E
MQVIHTITNFFTDEQIIDLDKIIEAHSNKPGSLIPMLEETQLLLGYIPECVQERIAEKADIAPNKIYGVVTFYSFFSMNQRARHRVQVCLGTACYVKGGKEIAEKIEENLGVKFGESTADGRFTYEKARCFGACGLAPIVLIDGKVYGKVTLDSIDGILSQYE